MKTAIVDNKLRVRIPYFKTGQVLAYEDNGNGTVTLTPVKPDAQEPFPEGSLRKYVDEWNKEFGTMASKMPVPPPSGD